MQRLARLAALAALTSGSALASTGPQSDPTADALLARAAAQAEPRPATDADVAEAEREAQAAELDLAIGAVRVGVLKARARLMHGRPHDAIAVAETSLSMIDRLPPDVDRAALAQPLHEIIAEARQSVPAAEPARTPHRIEHHRAHPRPRQPEPGEPHGAFERATQTGGRALDAKAQAVRDYTLDRASEPMDIERRVFAYPGDWEARSRGRERFRDGRIYVGPEFRSEDGELRQTVVYDVAALVHDAPQFTDAPQLDLAVAMRTMLDREALRRGSQIFNGYPSDLAAGIPLLYYFGGVEEGPIRATGGTEARLEDLSHLIQQVIEAR